MDQLSFDSLKGSKKQPITTQAINELFGIRESFELPEALLKKLLDKQEKDRLCDDFIKQFEFDKNCDCLRDYFQSSAANRSDLKQDYTPDCLAKLLSQLAPQAEKIIDICAGTGALTIGMNRDIEFQCEELSQMSIPVLLFNPTLRGINATVVQKNVLLNQIEKVYKLTKTEKYSNIEIINSYEEQKADVVISNPPYSLKWEPKYDKRFEGYELAPAKASDYAFVLDGLSRLTEQGQALYILPHGVLFRGNAEGKIRKQLIENNLIDAVISLPENMFLNTSIPVAVLVFNKAKKTDDVLFVSAEKLFEKHGKQNVMTDEHIQKIAETYHNRKAVEKLSNVVSLSEIRHNDYNLNIPRYVDTFEKEELPPLSEITKDILKADLEIHKATNDLMKILQNLCGDDEYNELKDAFVRYFTEKDMVGETMAEWLELQVLESKVDHIVKNAKRERRPIFDLANFERVKKGKVYDVGTVYIQLSATDGKVRYLCETKELETKYGVFVPKSKNLCTRYLFYMLDFEMPEFLAKYQCGMNINPDIFKYLHVTYYPETKYQKELAMTLDSIQYRYDKEAEEKDFWGIFKKYHLDGIFPQCG